MLATLSKLSLLVLATVQLAHSLATSRRSTCTEPSIRVEWNTLTEDQKAAYFAAELCLFAAPAKTGIPGVVSRYDDLVGAHAQQADLQDNNDFWHATGQFVHVHRYYTYAHETLLRTECGYTGPLPYWNELADAGKFATSPVLLDFGGNGSEEDDWAVVDGPFANLTRYFGYGTTNTKHLLTRRVNETASLEAGQTYVDTVLAQETLSGFKTALGIFMSQSGVHPGGHLGIGGDVRDYVTSPNDPMFFMHHGYMDYLWWKWQGDNKTRINDLNNIGYETQKEPSTGYVETSGDTVIYLFDILPDVTVADVLDTQNGLFCYTYAT
ncbi:Di-copper centre-containing protein [Armillaria gallica]|uniref:Di-copper centre-containing protein n=1 Tax=Armillaria gallica TaxID=47427 RepID=A0A2H3DHE5_ARMGA|nr:Di-copper centre-containing protein [Armillaria gallica]